MFGMARVRGSVAASVATLVLSCPASGQEALDLREADARNAAYEIMTAAEEQFDCELEEHSMREVGHGVRYLFHVRAEGNECREALIFVTNQASRDDKLIFRQVADADQMSGDPLILYGEVLIHEVNPETEDSHEPEE